MRRFPSKTAVLVPFLLCHFISLIAQNTTLPVNVGVILDLEESAGEIGLSCINMALSDFYATDQGRQYRTRLILNARESIKDDVVSAAAAALELIKTVEVKAIIGPSTSMQTHFVIDIGDRVHVPIISYTASSPSLTSIRSPYFFRATENDSTQVNVIREIIRSFEWRLAVPIYVDNEYGQGIMPYLVDALQEIDTRIPYRSAISPSASDDQITAELYKLMSMQTRVFIVHMTPPLGSRLFAIAKEIGMISEGYVWIMTSGMTQFLSSLDSLAIHSMHGAIGVMPYVPKTKALETFQLRWKRKFQLDNPGSAYPEFPVFQLRAYDAAIALAMAIENVQTANFGFRKVNASKYSTDLSTLGISENGEALMQALSNTNFKGLTGDFKFLNGQLQVSTFQIVNVIGDGSRELGFWTPENKLVKKLKSVAYTNMHSDPKSRLATVIWPGDSTSVPKGWQIPTYGKKLKIGVPTKHGFNEFVKVEIDPITNVTTVKGFCIDVFEAVIEELPYALTYEFIPFKNPGGSRAATYDEMIYQVYLQEFDAVVGDTTINGNRTFYVDFTLPYTDSGVAMIVPVRDDESNNAWAFLKPLTWDLWVTIFCFFIFIGFVVWFLEHRINDDFRGSPSRQAGTAFWFSFSTIVFSNNEPVTSNLSRMVILIWCFVLLILTQSYTANLTSLLTIQQLMPTVTDLNQLIKNGDNVGYQEGSFVYGILKKQGFDESKLKLYNSTEECEELLSKGSANGGISAAFDDIQCMKLLLSRHCSKYTKVDLNFKTSGWGFVLPKGSPLVSDLSRAILKVREGEKMKKIEDAWFGKVTSCADSTTPETSRSLSLQSFWGLFLISGIVSVSALLMSAATFLYQRRQLMLSSNSESSMWWRSVRFVQSIGPKGLEMQRGCSNSINLFGPKP